MKRLRYLLYFILFLLTILVLKSFVTNSIDWEISDKELSEFITEHNIPNASIKKVHSNMYYIFGDDVIYVFKGKGDFKETKNIRKDDIVFGGLQRGSVGLNIINQDVLLNSKLYSVTINNETRNYEYRGEKYIVITDDRIWNPDPQMTISFYDSSGKTIYEEVL